MSTSQIFSVPKFCFATRMIVKKTKFLPLCVPWTPPLVSLPLLLHLRFISVIFLTVSLLLHFSLALILGAHFKPFCSRGSFSDTRVMEKMKKFLSQCVRGGAAEVAALAASLPLHLFFLFGSLSPVFSFLSLCPISGAYLESPALEGPSSTQG